MLKRKNAYKKLAIFLGIPIEKTHISTFNIEQCYKVIQYANDILEDKQ